MLAEDNRGRARIGGWFSRVHFIRRRERLMGIVGQTLDAMTNVQRDRAIEGQEWVGFWTRLFVDEASFRCLMDATIHPCDT